MTPPKDFLDAFLSEDTEPEKPKNPRLVFYSLPSKDDKLNETNLPTALSLADEAFVKTIAAFREFQLKLEDIGTRLVLTTAVNSFGDNAKAFHEFVMQYNNLNDNNYLESQMSNYIDYDMGKILVDTFLLDIYKKYIDGQKNAKTD